MRRNIDFSGVEVGQSIQKFLDFIVDKTVGFRLGSYKTGGVAVVPPEECPHIPSCVKPILSVSPRHHNSSVFLSLYL